MTTSQYSSLLFVGAYLDLGKNELRNATIQNLASAPGSPVEGQIYWDTTTHTMQARNNAAFFGILDGGAVAQSKTGQLTLTGGLVVNTTGITGNKEINLTGTGTSGVAGNFTAPILISSGNTGATAASRYAGATASAAPASGTYAVGDFVISQTGDVYVCTSAGTPGTWVRVGSYLLGGTNTWTASNTFSGGIVANSAITGNGTINLTGTGAGSVGGTFSATQHIATGQTGAATSTKYAGGTASGAPGSGTFSTGDWIVTTGGDVYVCSSGGSPGTWVRVGSYLLGATNSWTGANTFTNGVIVNTVGITGNKEINLTGTGTSAVGGTFTATVLIPSGITGAVAASRYVGATSGAAPSTGTFVTGDFAIGQTGSVFICTAGGSPGTWVTLTSAGTIYNQSIKANNGTAITQRATMNFISGTYTAATAVDNASQSDIKFDVVPANITINLLGATTADFSMNTHKITNLVDPTSAQDAATKNYVDLMRQGIEYKDSVAAATTGALPNSPTYSNGTAGVGATLTAGSNVAFPSTLDGVTTALNMRVLVKDQASQLQNGIYVLSAVGSGAAPWVLTRAADNDSTTSTPPRMTAGDVVFVDSGTVNGGVLYAMNQTAAITMGTTAITYTAISGATTITAGAGLTATGNVYAVGAGTGITVAADTVSVDTSIVTQKYIAGTGPGSTGTTWAITHNLGNRDVIVQVYDASTYATVNCDVVRTSTTVVTLNFDSNVTLNTLRAVVIG